MKSYLPPNVTHQELENAMSPAFNDEITEREMLIRDYCCKQIHSNIAACHGLTYEEFREKLNTLFEYDKDVKKEIDALVDKHTRIINTLINNFAHRI